MQSYLFESLFGEPVVRYTHSLSQMAEYLKPQLHPVLIVKAPVARVWRTVGHAVHQTCFHILLADEDTAGLASLEINQNGVAQIVEADVREPHVSVGEVSGTLKLSESVEAAAQQKTPQFWT